LGAAAHRCAHSLICGSLLSNIGLFCGSLLSDVGESFRRSCA